MFETSGFFSIRTPLLPFDDLLKWGDGLESPSAVGREYDLRRAVEADRILLRSRMGIAFTDPAVLEAVYVASPDLYERIGIWKRAPETERGRGIERALVRYFVRMTGRATPFGLFAGCSVGLIGDYTRLSLEARAACRRYTRLDMGYLHTLADAIANAAEFRETLTYRPNPSLYRAAGRIRYIESRSQGQRRTSHLVVVDETAALERALEAAGGGAGLAAIAAAVNAGGHGITHEEVERFISELIARQIIVPDIRVLITGPEALDGLIEQLAAFPEMRHVAARMEDVRTELRALDAEGLGIEVARYDAAAAHLRHLPPELDRSRLFHVDMTRPVSRASLGPGPLREIQRGAEFLRRLTHNRRDRLTRFRESFVARYGDREVPLIEALDEEAGIGYEAEQDSLDGAAPCLRGLVLPSIAEEDTVTAGGRWHTGLLRKLAQALTRGSHEIVLTPDDFNDARDDLSPPLPDAFAACVVLAATSEEAVARGDFRVVLKSISGPSGAMLLGRFCQGDDVLREQVERHLRAEESLAPAAVFAEVVHLPDGGRVGNVLRRPLLRKYEIPILGESGMPEENQISVTDLMVSVSDERIVLRSERLGCEVIPRLTSAHNYDNPRLLGIYRFLCMLQSQRGAAWQTWSWGALERSPFLPRVRVGRLILSLARWDISGDEAKSLCEGNDGSRLLALRKWRSERNVPRFVGLLDGDNKLTLDLDNALCLDVLIERLRKKEGAILEEVYPGPDEMLSTGPEGRYVHELIVPFVRVGRASRHSLPAAPEPRSRETRTFAPGSDWLYVKFYMGSATADHLLCELVAPAVVSAIESGAADTWFFVRYGDPDWHIRLRLHGMPEALWGRVLPSLHAALAPHMAGGRVWRVQLDTYERELERYGGVEAAEVAERLFQADSVAALDIVNYYRGDGGAQARCRLAILGADMLLSDFGFDLETKRRVVAGVRGALFREFQCDAEFRRQLGKKYRGERADVEMLLGQDGSRNDYLERGVSALGRRSLQIASLVGQLRRYGSEGLLSRPLEELAASYIHMHLNRVLRSDHRAQELVIYDSLYRVYESRARKGF